MNIKNTHKYVVRIIIHTIIFCSIVGLFNEIYVEPKNKLFWIVIIVLMKLLLNKILKPILLFLTIPIVGMTYGLFYPFINLFILKIIDWILQDKFYISNIIVGLIFSVLLSVTNTIIEEIIKTIIKRVKKYE